jgi:hypothetical protein
MIAKSRQRGATVDTPIFDPRASFGSPMMKKNTRNEPWNNTIAFGEVNAV